MRVNVGVNAYKLNPGNIKYRLQAVDHNRRRESSIRDPIGRRRSVRVNVRMRIKDVRPPADSWPVY